MKLKNLYLGLKDQLPWKRFWINFFVTRNAWGLFSKRSHFNENGVEKVKFSKKSALKAAEQMGKKRNTHFSAYKCIYCDGYHIGKNRDNKVD
jgi:hypothetical protein